MPLPPAGKSSKYVAPNHQQIQENSRRPKNNSPPGKNIMIKENEPFVNCYSVRKMPQFGSHGTLFGANENEISNGKILPQMDRTGHLVPMKMKYPMPMFMGKILPQMEL